MGVLDRITCRTSAAGIQYSALSVNTTHLSLPAVSLTEMRVSVMVGEMTAVVIMRCVGVVISMGPE